MAFELRPGKSVAKDLCRLARKELGRARDELAGTGTAGDESIHGARKSVKKVRAILELIETDEGDGLAGSAKRLRAVNRTLSGLRDAEAMIETFDTLHVAHPELFSARACAGLRRHLTARKQAMIRAAARDGALRDAAGRLGVLAKRAKHWQGAHDGFAALAPGLEKSHRRARKALARARETQAATDFHEWRKAVKALWYAVRLVGGGSTAIARDTRALDRAERWLGDDHNLSVLSAELSSDVSVRRSPLDIERLRRVVDRLQRALRRKAIARIRLVLAVKPGAYVRRVERAWQARRRGPIS
jgi:CHAD domain-containing protein